MSVQVIEKGSMKYLFLIKEFPKVKMKNKISNCAAQDGKNGRGQPSSFLVLSQIFTQSYRRVEREYSCPGDSML
jgi:hypothetical protein